MTDDVLIAASAKHPTQWAVLAYSPVRHARAGTSKYTDHVLARWQTLLSGVYIRMSNPGNTVHLRIAEATTMLMVEVKAFKIAIQRDSLKVGYQNTRNPAGPLIAWIPPSLRTVLMEDKYVYYYDSATESEIQLLVEPCDAEGTPQNRPPDQRVPDAREKAAAKAARDAREVARRLRTVRIRYDLPTRFLKESLKEPNSALNPVAKMIERAARSTVGEPHRVSVTQMRDHLDNERNTLDLYIEFRTQAEHDQAMLNALKYLSIDRGAHPLQGYIPPAKLADMRIQQCCFRKTAECTQDRSEGFRTCRASARYRNAAGYNPQATEFQSLKRSVTDAKLEARRSEAAKLQAVQEKRLCEPYREGKVRSALPTAYTYRTHFPQLRPQCPIEGCTAGPRAHRGPSYTSTITCTSARLFPEGGECRLNPCPYRNHVSRS